MKRKLFLLGVLISTCILPLHAQWYQKAAKSLSAMPKQTLPAMTDGQRAVHFAVQRARTLSLAKLQRAATCKPLSPAFQQAVFTIKEGRGWSKFTNFSKGTAFAIETTYRDEKRVWGVTAAQYGFKHPVITLPSGEEFDVSLQAKGTPQLSDLVLFPLPKNIAQKITPLPLSFEDAQVGDNLCSISFFEDKFHFMPNRLVEEVSFPRLTTTLAIEEGTDWRTASGGPVLNQDGEVVGIQVKADPQTQTGQVLPAAHIRQALNTYYSEGNPFHDIKLNGLFIGRMKVNDYIRKMEVWREGNLLRTTLTKDLPQSIDSEMLEKYIDIGGGDIVVVYVEHLPFSSNGKTHQPRSLRLVFNLWTHKTVVHRDRLFTASPNH